MKPQVQKNSNVPNKDATVISVPRTLVDSKLKN